MEQKEGNELLLRLRVCSNIEIEHPLSDVRAQMVEVDSSVGLLRATLVSVDTIATVMQVYFSLINISFYIFSEKQRVKTRYEMVQFITIFKITFFIADLNISVLKT